MTTLQVFTDEDFNVLAKTGIWPNKERHLAQFLTAVVENLRDGEGRLSRYPSYNVEDYTEVADGP